MSTGGGCTVASPNVRLIGLVTDIDGMVFAVGVDHETITFGTEHSPGAWARFNHGQRLELWRLLQDATVAALQYEADDGDARPAWRGFLAEVRRQGLPDDNAGECGTETTHPGSRAGAAADPPVRVHPAGRVLRHRSAEDRGDQRRRRGVRRGLVWR